MSRALKLGGLAAIPLVIFELGLRVAGVGGSIVYEENPVYGYRPKPSQRFQTAGYTVTINSAGFRSSIEKSDTLCLGCSVTYGCAIIRDEHTFAYRLGAVNAGVNGWGIRNMAAFLETLPLDRYKRVIWVIPTGIVLRPFTTLPHGLISTNRRMVFRLEYLLRYLWYGVMKMARDTSPRIPPDEALATNLAAVEKVVALCRKHGVSLYVFSIPNEYEARGGRTISLEYYGKLADHLAKLGVPTQLVMPSGDISAMYFDGCHLSTAGHEWFANELQRGLAELERMAGAVEQPAGG